MSDGERKRVFSGIQPTGGLSLANYAGALKNFKILQNECDCVFCVVDLHAITVRQEPAALRRNTHDALAIMMACGLEPENSIMFVQSHVSAHAEMAWILNCFTYFGELGRMTQFKDKSDKHSDNVNAGLFDYPVLMAGDILLYRTDIVPVGADQKQHLELSRDVAMRFNNVYGDVFTVPEPYIPKVGARIMSLQEPDKKMSKSDENENAYILLTDPPEVVTRKIKRAVTDSDNRVAFEEGKAGVANLMMLYSVATGLEIPDIQAEFEGKGYGIFKEKTADVVVELLTPIQARYAQLSNDRKYLEDVMRVGAEKAEMIAARTLAKVYKKIGLVPRPRQGAEA
jgi:tryptophanyl-tRNA synthetase